jgi:pyruvate kinase
VDFLELSFMRNDADAQEARALVRSLGHDVPLGVKLEKPSRRPVVGDPGRDHCITVARGDLDRDGDGDGIACE